ncbi:MAG: quinohemoprotein amine dehydrogenase subunit beta [Rhodospirillales bacterium]|nr:quinohemoprotein amine dehydrogenase subunit beta [Rhodospirillales bacterium]MDH3792203.1 quinohemoprotein amine dehydrogenase subunit beta [Rhodospirillales bacterium]MDH3912848.1 quinohemoprotein amine dehydrogenase subunit beta [Rhodospirillales bacterium]MDH3918452.1 quinohemoprotein amine dehydrogenase subunit beta [Rhodospirillales bacterium]MDH3967455.1 quinohemoprotein amine dehydrogenase subunit beta [Rhodospirillales bacterium]
MLHSFKKSALLGVLLALAVAPAAVPGAADAKDILLTGVKPDKIVMVDVKAREVIKTLEIPNAAPGNLTITPSPDGKIAYTIVNRWESVSGIDLDSGKEVFRADFSSGKTRVKAMFAMDISPDGKELFVFQSPVKLGLGEYEVQDTRVAVYNTADGIGAKPVRLMPAPRRTAVMSLSKDGKKLYLLNWDLTVMDPMTGAVVDVHKVRNWGRANFGEPDILDVWPQWETAGVFSTPYYVVRTDKSPDDPAAYKTGLLTLDLETDEFKMDGFEDTAVVIFSSVINPVRRNEAYMVYTTLSKVDMSKPLAERLVKRINLDHTYYAVNVSSDGTEIYVGGTMDDIAVYSTADLSRIGTIKMPDGGDQALSSLRLIQR